MNVGKLLKKIKEKKENEIAIVFKGIDYTYKNLEENTNKVTNFLKDLGVTKGTKVGIYMLNNPEYICIFCNFQNRSDSSSSWP